MGPKLEMKQELSKKSILSCATDLSVLKQTLATLVLTVLSTGCVQKKTEQNSNPVSTHEKENTFVINLPRELQTVDPLLLRGTAKRYVLFNLHRGLYHYGKDNKLISHGAEDCKWTSPKMYECKLKNKKWSDGSPILAKHYVYTYEQIKKSQEESLEVLQGVKSIEAVNELKLRIVFAKKITDVRHRLTSVLLTPRNKNTLFKDPSKQLFSGPYKINELTKSAVYLESNIEFDQSTRPPIKGVFVDDPTAALNMYEAGNLSFLRYLESTNVKSYSNVLQVPFAKLDGLFFNKKKLSLNARKALMLSLNFKSLQKLYNNPAQPGCLAVPKSFFKKPVDCLEFNLNKALNFYEQSELPSKKLTIHIPNADTSEHKKLALWARSEWLKNLKLKVQIELVETKMFYAGVRAGKYSIYRKAHPLRNLGCTDAMMSIKAEPEFLDIVATDCREFFKNALEQNTWLPLGTPYYAHLPSKKFSGYYINLLGQFGLEGLHIKK